MKALTFSSFGKPDVLEYIEVNEPVLKQDEILVQMKATGLNYADMMRQSGIYNVRGNAPYINGYEGAAIVAGPYSGIEGGGNGRPRRGDREHAVLLIR